MLVVLIEGFGDDTLDLLPELAPEVTWRSGDRPEAPEVIVVHIADERTAYLCTRTIRNGTGLYLRLSGPPASWAVAIDPECGQAADRQYTAVRRV